MRNFVIRLDGPNPSVELDGKPVACREVYVSQKQAEFPKVVIVLDATKTDVSGLGDVEVGVLGNSASDFLARIDPRKLEEAALQDTSMADNPTIALLSTLKEWADAQP